ncbi:PTPLA-domain-containing protein [Hesseltinella vesiculosa]|uniref:Very-long-chain (3R)-3-hydroxyacyl-CoA dehydratase n=1 Tax=Hesseltinella vesiculosa TaxID=101127 RepID=A0A1X2G3Y0_9FUNG|nr:PTPLA-domain-containing protein [Hesseltinella vesiculosa]
MHPGLSSTKKQQCGFVKTYLVAYNVASWAGWFAILLKALSELYQSQGNWTHVFDATWPLLQIVQTCALFEVFHSLIGWVRAPFMTTLMQVLSRLLLVWGVNYLFPQIHTHGSYTTMIIAWCIAELVRYSFYAFNLVTGSVPFAISWARYNFFLVLYPLGVGSELMMIYQSLPFADKVHPFYVYFLVGSALTYVPGKEKGRLSGD